MRFYYLKKVIQLYQKNNIKNNYTLHLEIIIKHYI